MKNVIRSGMHLKVEYAEILNVFDERDDLDESWE